MYLFNSLQQQLSTAHDSETCINCGGNATLDTFTDDRSIKEYQISGLCQKCQDEVFNA